MAQLWLQDQQAFNSISKGHHYGTLALPQHAWDFFDGFFDAVARDGISRQHARTGFSDVRVTVEKTADGATVRLPLPGVSEQDIELTLEADTLTVVAKRTASVPEGAKVLHRERGDVNVTKRVRLPFRVDHSRGDANYHNGVLTITAYRQEADKPRRIEVHRADSKLMRQPLPLLQSSKINKS